MLPIRWRLTARQNLADIIRYIAAENPAAARRLKQTVETCVLPAAEHPYLYRAGRLAGTREIVAHPNYIVVYQIETDRIEVLAVLHARQEYPNRS